MFSFFRKAAQHITVLPHARLCPEGEIVPLKEGKSLAETLLKHGIEISHSCQLQCACATCHVHVMEGSSSLSPMAADEDRMLKNAAGRDRFSRLACQAVFQGGGDVVLEIAADQG